MSLWTSIKSLLGFGASAAGSAVGGVASGGILPTVEAGAKFGKAVIDGTREANRAATDGALAKERDRNDSAIDAAIDAAKKIAPALLLALLLAGGVSGCANAPARTSSPSTGNVGRLLARPDFHDAARAAPEWTRDALKTVNDLEFQNQEERAAARRVQ